MLMFVYVLGNAFNVGEHYIEYATPGLIVLAISYGLSAIAASVNPDIAKGITNRFKVMNGSRGAVLTGNVMATMLSSSVAIAVIIGMAFALGFRSPATLLEPARRDRYHRGDSFRGRVARGRARNGCENSGIRRPHRRAADHSAIRKQRDRASCQGGTGSPAICRVSALHADYRLVAWIARRHPAGRLRGRRYRLVRRDRPRRVPVGACHIQEASVTRDLPGDGFRRP